MQLERPVVHVGAAHQGHLPVYHDALGVDEAGGIAVNLDAVGQQLTPVGLRHHIDIFLVRDGGYHQPHVHPCVGGDAQGLLHGLLHRVIGRGDIQHLLGGGDQLEVGVLDGIVRIVQRTVREGLAPAGALDLHPGTVVVVLIGQGAADHLPHLNELGGKAPGPGTVDPDTGILPVAEPDKEVGVFIGNIDASGVGVHPVNDGDLPVVPVVEVNPIHVAVDWIEHLHLHAGVLQGLEGGVGKAGEVAEVVEDDPHLHTGGGPLPQHMEDPVPDLALRQDVILQEDVDLRSLEVEHQVIEEIGSLREIPGL